LLKGQFTGSSTLINMKDLSSGVYYLQMMNGDGKVLKIVKE